MDIPFAFDIFLPQGPVGNTAQRRADGTFDQHVVQRRTLDQKVIPHSGIFQWRSSEGKAIPICEAKSKRVIYPIALMGSVREFLFHPSDGMFVGVSEIAHQAIRDRRALLLLDGSTEGHCPRHWHLFEGLHDEFDRAGFPPSQVIFVTSNLTAEAIYQEWCVNTPPMRVVSVNFFMASIAAHCRNSPEKFVSHATHVLRPTHFLNFNRRRRPHRVKFVAGIVRRGLLPQFCVSFPPMEQPHTPDQELLFPLTPMIVDQTDFSFNHAATHNKQPYLQTYISVVSETAFAEAIGLSIFFSEKTFKAIANLHPFILIGTPGILRTLRSLGYSTFAPFIDERYDDEFSHDTRMAMILDEVTRLASLPITMIADWYHSIMPILLSNREILLATPANPYTAIQPILADFVSQP